MTFGGRDWLVPIYKDKSQQKVFLKSTQCGLSEYAVVSSFAKMMAGRSVLYILPTLEMRNKFVPNRFDRRVDESEYYKSGNAGTDNRGLKFFWKGSINFVGSNVLGSFREYPADDIYYDELDLCDMKNITYAQDRLSATAELGIVASQTKLSNPTVPKYGIDLAYEESDKKEWHIKCPSCNSWQPLSWFDNFIDQQTALPFTPDKTGSPVVVCRSCRKEINRTGPGEWVAEHPGRDISGYHISKLFTKQATEAELFAAFLKGKQNATDMQRFYNSDLGLPFTGSGEKLDLDVFSSCTIPGYQLPFTSENCVAGIDVGGVLHIRISNLSNGKRRMVYVGTVPNFDELSNILKRYKVRLYVIDARPEYHKVFEFIQKNPGGWACDFHPDASISDIKVDKAARTIKVNRTRAFDENVAAYINRQVELPENWRTLDRGDWLSQMMAPVRRLDEDRKPPAFIWDEGGQPDHYCLADIYEHQAAKLCGFGGQSYRVEWVG